MSLLIVFEEVKLVFFFFPLFSWYLSLHLDDFVQIVKENVDIGLLSCIYFL